MNEEKKKAKKKSTAEIGIYENMKKEEPNKREEVGALVDDIPKLLVQPSDHQDDDEEDDDDDEHAPKKKCEIVDLRKKLSFRRKTGKVPAKALNAWEAKTEEDKINDAKRHLAWLQEKQKKNIIVDFFGVPKSKPSAVMVEPSSESIKNEVSGSSGETSKEDHSESINEQLVDEMNKNEIKEQGWIFQIVTYNMLIYFKKTNLSFRI